ncbi:MAG: DUF1778 domain-containing protein [Planctomycetes bacterium]|nr:DUF1778 domain-containing protein [Planctomycetota bacterium]
MNITLRLSPENAKKLERRAAVSGMDVDGYVLDIVQQELGSDTQESAAPAVPYDQWKREFDAWISSRPSRNPAFDDSRESIYD